MGYRIEHWNEVSHIIEDGPTPEGRLFCSFIGDDHIQKSDRVVGLLRGQPAQPAGPTVRCRIAVAVSPGVYWFARGSGTEQPESDENILADLKEDFGKITQHDRVVWIEASVPIPQPVEPAVIEGTVSDAKGGE